MSPLRKMKLFAWAFAFALSLAAASATDSASGTLYIKGETPSIVFESSSGSNCTLTMVGGRLQTNCVIESTAVSPQ